MEHVCAFSMCTLIYSTKQRCRSRNLKEQSTYIRFNIADFSRCRPLRNPRFVLKMLTLIQNQNKNQNGEDCGKSINPNSGILWTSLQKKEELCSRWIGGF